METGFFSTMNGQKFVSLWSKYRPVLLKLMLNSKTEPQQYKLFVHEFKSLSQKQKDFSFTLKAYRGKAINDIRSSDVALDLLYMLKLSKTASELMDESGYEFALDKQFTLKVNRLENVN